MHPQDEWENAHSRKRDDGRWEFIAASQIERNQPMPQRPWWARMLGRGV